MGISKTCPKCAGIECENYKCGPDKHFFCFECGYYHDDEEMLDEEDRPIRWGRGHRRKVSTGGGFGVMFISSDDTMIKLISLSEDEETRSKQLKEVKLLEGQGFHIEIKEITKH